MSKNDDAADKSTVHGSDPAELTMGERPDASPVERPGKPSSAEESDSGVGRTEGLHLLLDGASTEGVTTEFLTDVADVADEHGLSTTGVSILRQRSDDSPVDRD